ncbi:hypothetical protein AciM339_0874 [Aciduliprofundum sp. MAR08-339]|uniref:LiaI-LiaF-like domain-containing protein n=1 Tax=Aciduliprofundum sp. (strain MAR08-339) TaxID=673860 RepID=UPI0002A48B78|nr:hypothetical protein AciM339_0874 [Aciduliprofundum sp. MAR08-339]
MMHGIDTGRIIGGIFLILIGVLWLLDMLGFIKFNICIIGPLLLIASGFALLIKRDDWW